MALQNYSGLLSAISQWMARADVAGDASDFITLGEARLNRELDPVEVESTITGITGSRFIDITSLGVEEPVSLFMSRPGQREYEVTPKAAGTYPILDVAGVPNSWSRDGNNIAFDRPLGGEYEFRFRYSQYFRLSNVVTTNWLLTNHPDVYLAACLVWGGLFIRDSPYAAQWQAVLNSGLPEVGHAITQSKRGVLSVDPMLQRIGQPIRGVYNGGAFGWP